MNLHENNQLKICIIGTGNVASHLFNALKDKSCVKMVSSRSFQGLAEDSDIYIIAVKDNAIEEVANRLSDHIKKPTSIIAHTSGTTLISVLNNLKFRYGVIYPMQTFTKNKSLDYSKIPFFIEGCDRDTYEILYAVASVISKNVRFADSSRRRKIHLSSVLACNFTNRLWTIADKILQEEGMDVSILFPLISETFDKIKTMSPEEAQTGPARRGDNFTLDSHLKILSREPELQKIYRILSENIYKAYNK